MINPSSAIGRILPGLSAVVEVDTESATQSHELAKATAGQAMSVTAGH